jgi:predicted MFS family arabinose efflux permease
MALVNSFGALGGFVGAYLVGLLVGNRQEGTAFIFMAACLVAAALLMLPIRPPASTEQEKEGLRLAPPVS